MIRISIKTIMINSIKKLIFFILFIPIVSLAQDKKETEQ